MADEDKSEEKRDLDASSVGVSRKSSKKKASSSVSKGVKKTVKKGTKKDAKKDTKKDTNKGAKKGTDEGSISKASGGSDLKGSSRGGVLQIVSNLDSGSMQRNAVELAIGVKKAGYDSYVCSSASDGPNFRLLKDAGIDVLELPMNSRNIFSIMRNVFVISDFVKQKNIDILHVHSRTAAWTTFFVSKLTKCKVVTTFHTRYDSGGNLQRFFNSVMLRGDVVTSVSPFISKHIETHYHIDTDDIKLISGCADLSLFNPGAVKKERVDALRAEICLSVSDYSDRKTLLLPARFYKTKGHMLLLRALKYLPSKSYVCIFAGSMSKDREFYIDEMKAYARECGISDNIIYSDNVHDMPALYALADIVFMTSIKPEAFGRIVVEAQAMEKIVIATAHGGALETIEEGKTGFLVSPTDPSELADTIKGVFKMSKSEIEAIEKAARKSVKEKYSTEATVSSTIAIYRSLLHPEKP